MSYQAVDQLINDPTFGGRSRAAVLQQAQTFINDGRSDIAAAAQDCLRDVGGSVFAFLRLAAAGPGIAANVDNGDGTVDQSKVTDADLLALTQANFPVVAGLFFDGDGNRIPLDT